MATMNPLEQKARSSFIKGFIIALLIGIIIAGFLGMELYKKIGEENQRIAAQKTVLVMKSAVKSGEEVTEAMFTTKKVDADVAPATALTTAAYGTLAAQTDSQGNVVTNEKGEAISNKILAKIDIDAKTVLTTDMITTEEANVTDDLREQEYNTVVLPTLLSTGDTIDIRLRLPSGVDYIVVAKKKVTIPELGTNTAATTILMNLTESETLTMSAAIVDAYKITGSKLYATKYTDPGIQNAATLTYVPSSETKDIVDKDPNQVTTARNALVTLYNLYYDTYRKYINSALSTVDSTTQQTQVQSGTSTETAAQQSQRKTYLDSLAQ